MRKILCARALALALGCPASAGIIHNPPPAPSPIEEPSDGGEILTPPLAALVLTLSALF